MKQKIHWVDVRYNPVLRLEKCDPPTIDKAFELSKSTQRIKYLANEVQVIEDKHKKEVVGVVKFTPYEKMNEDERKSLDGTCEYIMKEKKMLKVLIRSSKFKALSFGTHDHKDNQNPDAFGGNLSFTMGCLSGIPQTNCETPGGWGQGV
ncbi:uncharacterized protein MELLADRAFT_112448 [Melampsora larici-populina 98AG31]|uniref:Uncharacterized protein n=1 Tax=Melampsora larici-populina (strain 98AG31 / pathotype 3-4-7) TaxID=747676 RepID=F4S6I3_MELLP|nr:uncharacterized protein MELLADRAFT_112448 [Melampsora larici-populina 98AG31]EGF99754.1 hypothetical protein MELLADRAFT_112448 [Melampsora larici-populina 98AG31]